MASRTPALLLLSLCTPLVAWSATPDELKCKTGNATACATAGRVRIDSEEYALAKPLLEKGCKKGSAEACDLALMYSKGEGMPQDKAKAKD